MVGRARERTKLEEKMASWQVLFVPMWWEWMKFDVRVSPCALQKNSSSISCLCLAALFAFLGENEPLELRCSGERKKVLRRIFRPPLVCQVALKVTPRKVLRKMPSAQGTDVSSFLLSFFSSSLSLSSSPPSSAFEAFARS